MATACGQHGAMAGANSGRRRLVARKADQKRTTETTRASVEDVHADGYVEPRDNRHDEAEKTDLDSLGHLTHWTIGVCDVSISRLLLDYSQ